MYRNLRELFPGAAEKRLRHAAKRAATLEEAVESVVETQKPGSAALEDSNEDDDNDDDETGANDEDGDSSTASGFAAKKKKKKSASDKSKGKFKASSKAVSTGWISTKPASSARDGKKKKQNAGKGGRAHHRKTRPRSR
jgi:hypothetical protein